MEDPGSRFEAAFGRTVQDYARHRAGFPDSFFERLARCGLLRAGRPALDLGTGTGSLARGLARRGMRVTALDPAPEMLAAARALDERAGLQVRYIEATAEATGLQDGAFSLVSAGQCWHWFERAEAAREALRLLAPGGHLVIAHFDWLPLPGNIVEATERLIRAHNPQWRMYGGMGLYPRWLNDLREAGFAGVESFSYDLDQPYSHEAWRGRVRASAGIAASLPPGAVAEFDAAHAAMLAARFPEEPLLVPHRVFAAIGHKQA